MILTLEDEEAEMLKKLLDHCLAELRDEIHHTDRAAFKTRLKDEESLLRRMLGKLRTHHLDTMGAEAGHEAK
jgi:hypothetical protein